jgi:uncharacterized protein (DUF433 family)
MSSHNNGWRTQPMYSFNEVAHLADVTTNTVRNWLYGYTTKERVVDPLLNPPSNQGYCSFLNMIEIVVAARFRKVKHTSFETVRRAHDNAKKLYSIEYPFAHLRLEAIGGHIIHMIVSDSFQAIDTPEQYTLPGLIRQTINELEFELELASKWYPVGKKIPIVIDPYVSSGVPVIEGRGITIETIEKRFYAGKQDPEFMAKDLALQESIILEAIRFAPKVFHRKEAALVDTSL